MYYAVGSFLERLWDSKTIKKMQVFLLMGEDHVLKEEVARVLQMYFMRPAKSVSVDGKDKGRLNSIVERQHLFGHEDMLILRIRNAPLFEFTNSVLDWMRDNYIVFMDVAEDTPKDKKIYTWIKEHGCIVNCKRYKEYEEDCVKLVVGLFRANGRVVSEEVAKEVLARSGGDTIRTSNMVRLLALSCGNNITVAEVNDKLNYERQDDVFELVSLIAFGKVSKVFFSLRAILDQGGYHRLLLDQLATLYANLWSVLRMPPGERADWQIAAGLGVGSHRARQLVHLQKRYDSKRVVSSYMSVMAAYENLYQKGHSEDLVMTRLMKELCETGMR